MLKNYRDFLLEAGLDLGGLGDAGGGEGGEKKGDVPDPEKEIAEKKKKKRKAAQKERAEELDKAEEELTEILKKAPKDFRDAFEKRIMKALEKDDRVVYHDLVLDIQTYQIPMARDNRAADIDATAPVVKILQRLNKNEYFG